MTLSNVHGDPCWGTLVECIACSLHPPQPLAVGPSCGMTCPTTSRAVKPTGSIRLMCVTVPWGREIGNKSLIFMYVYCVFKISIPLHTFTCPFCFGMILCGLVQIQIVVTFHLFRSLKCKFDQFCACSNPIILARVQLVLSCLKQVPIVVSQTGGVRKS